MKPRNQKTYRDIVERQNTKENFVITAYLLPKDRERLRNIKWARPEHYKRIVKYLILADQQGLLDDVKYISHEEFKELAKSLRHNRGANFNIKRK